MSESNFSRGSLHISGAGKSTGGYFEDVKISGSGKIVGDVDCIDLKISGAAKIQGNVKAKFAKISGSGVIAGDLKAGIFKGSGSSTINHNLECDEVILSGSSEIGNNITADKLRISGVASIGGNCESENFISEGIFKIKGLLNSENVDIRLGGPCKVSEIGGNDIKIRLFKNSGGFFKSFLPGLNMFGLETNLIEGDNIYLEDTICKVVRGVNVVLGANCNVDRVEYSESLKVGDNCKVLERVKI